MKEEIMRKIRKYFEMIKKHTYNIKNVWDKAKEVLKEKFIVEMPVLKNQKWSQINNLDFHL